MPALAQTDSMKGRKIMISQQRLDELKRCDNPYKFFDELSCEVNSIVKPYRKVFENKAHSFGEKHKKFQTAVDKWLKERKKPLLPSIFLPYQRRLLSANNTLSTERLSFLKQCQNQLSDILKQGVNINSHPVLCRETCILEQCQKRLYGTWKQCDNANENFNLRPELSIVEECLRDIREKYQEQDWKEIKIPHIFQTQRGHKHIKSPFTLLVPPDFPEDPLWWFNAYELTWYDSKAPIARNRFTCSPEDELLRSYIAITVLFNEQAEKRKETLIAPEIISEVFEPRFTEKVLKEYWTQTADQKKQRPTDYWPEIRNVLISDLEAVDRELDDKQNNEPESKKVKWDDRDPNYISASEAVVKFTGNKLPLPTLSKMLKPNGSIHYMRKKGKGCRVHIGDFITWAGKEYPPDNVRQKIADEVLDEREKQRRNKDGGYMKLAKRIAKNNQ